MVGILLYTMLLRQSKPGRYGKDDLNKCNNRGSSTDCCILQISGLFLPLFWMLCVTTSLCSYLYWNHHEGADCFTMESYQLACTLIALKTRRQNDHVQAKSQARLSMTTEIIKVLLRTRQNRQYNCTVDYSFAPLKIMNINMRRKLKMHCIRCLFQIKDFNLCSTHLPPRQNCSGPASLQTPSYRS